VHRGRLVDHGPARYQFNSREEDSYYVLLHTARGEEYVWGKDLQRALENSLSKAREDQEVIVRQTGSEVVTVRRPVLDSEGRTMDETEVKTHRHRWSVETTEFLASRATLAAVVRDAEVAPADGTKKHPELAGTYDKLHAAKLVADHQNYTKSDAERFLSRIRETLAQEIEQGEPLSAAVDRARFRGPASTPRTHQRVQERVL
jgi:uncharacterized Zn finger protein